jgi:hypothetical protein
MAVKGLSFSTESLLGLAPAVDRHGVPGPVMAKVTGAVEPITTVL